ncbi:hypothetical protein [Pyrococcus kukulkanii]|uniref:hypothetical protein n=1 Tax=Pyrococcus kukulkanii TaxID=1609559 RepID=UPI00356A6D6C
MRKLGVMLTLLLIISLVNAPSVHAAKQYTVYIIDIPGLGLAWMTPEGQEYLVQKVSEELGVYPNIRVVVVDTLDEMYQVIQQAKADPEGVIIINGHGEAIPLPTQYSDWRALYDDLRAIVEGGGIFVSIGGYPLYYWTRSSSTVRVGVDGAKYFLQASVLFWPSLGSTTVKTYSSTGLLNDPSLPSQVYVDVLPRPFHAEELSYPYLSAYEWRDSSHRWVIVGAIKLGSGWFVHSGIDGTNQWRVSIDLGVAMLKYVLNLPPLEQAVLYFRGDAGEEVTATVEYYGVRHTATGTLTLTVLEGTNTLRVYASGYTPKTVVMTPTTTTVTLTASTYTLTLSLAEPRTATVNGVAVTHSTEYTGRFGAVTTLTVTHPFYSESVVTHTFTAGGVRVVSLVRKTVTYRVVATDRDYGSTLLNTGVTTTAGQLTLTVSVEHYTPAIISTTLTGDASTTVELAPSTYTYVVVFGEPEAVTVNGRFVSSSTVCSGRYLYTTTLLITNPYYSGITTTHVFLEDEVVTVSLVRKTITVAVTGVDYDYGTPVVASLFTTTAGTNTFVLSREYYRPVTFVRDLTNDFTTEVTMTRTAFPVTLSLARGLVVYRGTTYTPEGGLVTITLGRGPESITLTGSSVYPTTVALDPFGPTIMSFTPSEAISFGKFSVPSSRPPLPIEEATNRAIGLVLELLTALLVAYAFVNIALGVVRGDLKKRARRIVIATMLAFLLVGVMDWIVGF